MPSQREEILQAAMALCDGILAPDCIEDIRWEDGDRITEAEGKELMALAMYELRLRLDRRRKLARGPAQRKALRLLRRFLTAEQREALRQGNGFLVTGSLAGIYRLYPRTGMVEQVEKHGRKWFGIRSFCIHAPYGEDGYSIEPPADTSLSHLLLLRADEAEFRATANGREAYPDCWNGEYLRLMRRFRTERAEAMAGDAQAIARCL